MVVAAGQLRTQDACVCADHPPGHKPARTDLPCYRRRRSRRGTGGPKTSGSSPRSGQRRPDLQEEVVLVASAAGQAIDRLGFAVHPLHQVGAQRPAAVGQGAGQIGFQSPCEHAQALPSRCAVPGTSASKRPTLSRPKPHVDSASAALRKEGLLRLPPTLAGWLQIRASDLGRAPGGRTLGVFCPTNPAEPAQEVNLTPFGQGINTPARPGRSAAARLRDAPPGRRSGSCRSWP